MNKWIMYGGIFLAGAILTFVYLTRIKAPNGIEAGSGNGNL